MNYRSASYSSHPLLDTDTIMRPTLAHFACLGLLAALTLPAVAQQTATPPTTPAPPPPKMEKLEEVSQPAVTVRSAPEQNRITEKRAPGGKRTEVKVTRGNNTYYLKPNDQPGSAQPGDAQATQSRPAEWRVMTFDGNSKLKEQSGAATVETATPPTPPAKPAQK